jgi:hypothetical protein
MMDWFAEASPRSKVRIAGVFYLLTFLMGALALLFAGRGLVVYGDVANLIATACYVGVTFVLYGHQAVGQYRTRWRGILGRDCPRADTEVRSTDSAYTPE